MFIIVLLLVGALVTPMLNAEDARIIGGRRANVGEFPYQVSLKYSRNGTHFCGGSIITKDWILTAAHCFTNLRPSELFVVVGTNYLNSGGQFYNVSEITSHGSFNSESNVNDIALLKIQGQIRGAPGVASIGLADSTTPPGSILVLSGWGLTSSSSNSYPNALQTINLRSISVAQCQQLLPGYAIYDTNLCTYMVAGLGMCKGDAGSPLVMNGVQHGIASWGIPCAKGYPDVFSSVSAHRRWIKNFLGI